MGAVVMAVAAVVTVAAVVEMAAVMGGVSSRVMGAWRTARAVGVRCPVPVHRTYEKAAKRAVHGERPWVPCRQVLRPLLKRSATSFGTVRRSYGHCTGHGLGAG
ncbi:hypothetical protein Smic_38080 [Streptomyces microflavus]|uniref:Uncharacterized protein n=1 Tax=Streptomyces microflavus TaxID=1919 RepID=A0A7J0CS06_STRMI|nr:hypothetical protein Smic_38080 [Streptomyces microflavus]